MIPLVIDGRDKKVVICGGGTVGARKAAYFSGECRISIISRSFCDEIRSLEAEMVESDIMAADDDELGGLLEGAFLAIGATSDPRVNRRIADICGRMGILFNSADGTEGDVFMPSMIRGESYCIAVTTYGKSPAVPAYIREILEDEIRDLDGIIEVQEELREYLRNVEPSADKRGEILRAVIRDRDIRNLSATDTAMAILKAKKRYIHG